ncbi:MAG: hypothetical protein IJX08_09145 [Clostridia bacterium]|nr:hypothetical protein [Clostridia bacterium]
MPIKVSIGDYLLFAIAYRWISHLTYCANPKSSKDDFLWSTIKDFKEVHTEDDPVLSEIQLLYNPNMKSPQRNAPWTVKETYIKSSKKEPEVSFLIIPTIEDVKYDGDFDFAVLAQSPNYTPTSTDFILDVFREYIVEE